MNVQLIAARDVYAYFKEETLLIDMREQSDFAKWHLPGAICIPYEEDYGQWRARLPQFRAVILYCARGNNSLYAAKQMGEAGDMVYAVAGGVEALRKI